MGPATVSAGYGGAGGATLQGPNQLGYLRPPSPVRHDHRLPAAEGGDRWRQILRGGHLRVLDQDGDDPHRAVERHLELPADEIVLAVDTAAAVLVRGGDPLRADDGEQDVSTLDRLHDHLLEVGTDLDGFDVDEDMIVTEVFRQIVVQPAGVRRSILAPIADEDPKPRIAARRCSALTHSPIPAPAA